MPRRSPRALMLPLLCTAAAGLACGEPSTPESEGVTYYRDIKPLVDAYCIECHVADGVAPLRLDTYDAIREFASVLPTTLESRTMPPFPAAPTVRPLSYDRSLSDEQIAMVKAWVDAGAPMGDPAKEGPPIALARRELDRVDRLLEMPQPYTPTRVPDEYRCFVIDWDETETVYVTGVEFYPGNRSVAHHAVVYVVDEEYAPIVDAADGADGAPGYSCFGGASPDNVESFPTKLVAGWGPGVGASLFPEGSGSRVKPGVRVILQMHYSILNDGSQPDASSVGLRIEPSVEHDAGYLPFLDIEWTADPKSMLIPAGHSEVRYEYADDPTVSPLLGGFVPGVNPSQGLIVYAVLPHLHKLGKTISVSIERQDGAVDPLVKIDAWDFDYQQEYILEEPAILQPGDNLRLTCTWDNSAANQPVIMGKQREPADVTWGEGTYDEMCVASLLIRGVVDGDPGCGDVSSFPAESGRFLVTFDATSTVRDAADPSEPLRGPVYGAIYRDEDVTITGPKSGAEAVASFSFPDVDIDAGPSQTFVIDAELPAGRYQLLGFMDTDKNAGDGGDPDSGDPVLIPGAAHPLMCNEQPIVMNFGLLLP